MIPLLEMAARFIHLGLLRGASLLVPARRRSEWSQEWRTELWYVLRECSSESSATPRPIREATAFCLGAYQDAFYLRKRLWQKYPPLTEMRGSVALCLLILVALLIASWGIAVMSPGVRAEGDLSRIRIYSQPLLYPRRGSGVRASAAVAEEQARTSLGSKQRYFDGFSYYRVTQETVSSSTASRTQWTVALASSDLFAVLHLPLRFALHAGKTPDKLPRILLSEETWMTEFGGNPDIAGTEIHIGLLDARVAGVAFASSQNLPGKVNAWLLEPNSEISGDGAGFVVGHLTPFGYFQMGPRWAIPLFGVILAFLALPGITSMAMGDCSRDSQKPSLPKRSLFWAFFMAKISLLLPFVYFASLDLDCSFVRPLSDFSGYIQFISSLVLCLFGLRWAFRDQQRRCPVCLRRMAHPAEVGQPSRTFLSWNGTELVCKHGHTLLHIPETPTSWFAAQRWVYLDQSWQFLFARPSETSSLS
jgi:hypothetical protein